MYQSIDITHKIIHDMHIGNVVENELSLTLKYVGAVDFHIR